MTAVDSLNGLKKFIEEKVASKVLLQKEPNENDIPSNEPEYVHPYVEIMTLPHKNFTPVNFQVPYILIGLTNGTDAANEHPLNIQIQFATYGGNMMFKETANIPDSSGFIDLLNLIEKTKHELVQEPTINGCGVVNKPIMYGVYNEQITYPYSYGYLTFDMQIENTLRQMTEFL